MYSKHFKGIRIKQLCFIICPIHRRGQSWPLSYGSRIYNYLCNQCLSPLRLWVQILLGRGVLDTILCDKVCQWLVACRRFSPGIRVSSTIKIDCDDIAEILLKVVLNTITPTQFTKRRHIELSQVILLLILLMQIVWGRDFCLDDNAKCIYNLYVYV